MKKVSFEMSMSGAQVLDVMNAITTKTKIDIDNRNYWQNEFLRIKTISTFEFTPEMISTLTDMNISNVKLRAASVSLFLTNEKMPKNPIFEDIKYRYIDLLVTPFKIEGDKKVNCRTTRRTRTSWNNRLIPGLKDKPTIRTFDQIWRFVTNNKVISIYDTTIKQALPVIRDLASNHMMIVDQFNIKAALAAIANY